MDTKKASPGLRVLKIVLFSLLGLILALGAGVYALWHNELGALLSIKQLNAPDGARKDGAVYQMEVPGGYYFDEFLEQGGASTDKELISFITQRITKGLIPMNIGESDIACSSFTAATPAGDRLFARNYDFSRTNTCIVYTNPGHGRHASVSTVDLQFIGIAQDSVPQGLMDKVLMLAAPYVPLDGVNDAGLACGIYMSFQGPEGNTPPTDQRTEKPDLTSTTMLRMVLDYASTVEEAVELISAYDLHDSANSTFHYMIADASGRSAVLEWVNATDSADTDGTKRELNVIWSGGAPWQAVTNYILTPGYYDGEPEESMKGLDRYERLTAALEEAQGILEDEEAAMELLSQVGRRSWNPDGDTVTVHSVVYDLTHRTALWVGNEHYGEPAYTYRLAPAS